MKNDDKHLSNKDIRCQTAINQLAMLRATGGIHNPAMRQLWRIGTSQLGGGRYADKAQAMLNRLATPAFLAQQFAPRPLPRMPVVPEKYAILLGYEYKTRRPIMIHRDRLAHTLLVGATSMGKSRLVFSIVDQIMKQNASGKMNHVDIVIDDFKGESVGLMKIYPKDVAILRPDQIPRNILQPKGHARTYFQGIFAVIQRYSNMRPETWTELPGILIRMDKSRRPDDPPPSLVDLERNLRKMAITENRPNLNTAARGVAALIEVLGQSARIRMVKNS